MPQIQCPGCQKVFRVKDEWAGKRVKCPCGNQLVVPKLENAVQAAASATIKKVPLVASPVAQPVAQTTPMSPLTGAMSGTVPSDFNQPAAAFNPYAPTSATIPETGEGDEATRKKYLSHEASIKSIGVLYLLGSILGFLGTVVYLVLGLANVIMPSRNPAESLGLGIFLLAFAVFAGAFSTFQFILARGLRRLTPWCRIAGIVVSCLGLLGFPIGTLISAYFLYLLGSQKGVYVFSPEYARVIAATPHIKYKTSIIVWIFLGILMFVIGLAVIGVIVSAFVG
jgi:hypothetical protein